MKINDDVQPEVGAVLNKDLENIAKKVAAGKTLTSSEREHFMQQQPEVKDDNKSGNRRHRAQQGCLMAHLHRPKQEMPRRQRLRRT